MLTLALVLLAATAGDTRGGEDEAHRADRLRTEQLNHWAAAVSGRSSYQVSVGDRSRYDAARARYVDEMARWRRQVAACEAGDYAACR